MRKKFVFIGAGSLVFTTNLIRDILSFEAFSDAELHLVDIDKKRLSYAEQAANKIIEAGNYGAVVRPTMNRKEALEGADGVIITILHGGVDVWRHDIEIPKKYGVDINVGDTRGPSGVFRFLRTAPVLMEIMRDIEALCPNAMVQNYTNPMGMLCNYLQRMSKVKVTGLCHSVQGTAEMLAEWIGAKPSEVTYTCSGINHQAFYLDFKWNGEDAYPLLKEKVLNDPAISAAEPVRNEMFLNLGYYPTESSGHNSEYLPWFRKRQDLIEKYCTHGTNWNPGEYAYILKGALKSVDTWETHFTDFLANDKIDLSKGPEYASDIFNALFGDGTPFVFNGNQLNNGIIPNLSPLACVETPVMASVHGLQYLQAGELPDNLAILINTSARVEEMAVNAAIEGDPWKVFQANLFDPLTASVCSMAEIKQMTQEMLDINAEYLGYFKSIKL